MILRAVGVESEMELAFAGLHQLCAPFLDRLDRLPPPQRDALSVVFGLLPDLRVEGLSDADARAVLRTALRSPLDPAVLDPRTVEWHLRKVFMKLGVSSRKELYDALPEDVRVSVPG